MTKIKRIENKENRECSECNLVTTYLYGLKDENKATPDDEMFCAVCFVEWLHKLNATVEIE